MRPQLKFVTMITSLLVLMAIAKAQNLGTEATRPATPPCPHLKNAAAPCIEMQLIQMREELQNQINELKVRLSEKDAQIAALQSQNAQNGASLAAAQAQSTEGGVHQNAGTISGLEAQTTSASTSTLKAQDILQKKLEAPASLRYKGITIVPGGFLAGESIWRQRAMNADVYTNFNATPYMNSGEAHMSEWVPSARQSRFSTLFSGKVPFGTLSGFFEGDFLSAGTTSNNLQSNSYTLRVRQAWAQATFGHLKFTGGQMWTLLMENKKSTDPGQEMAPLFFDANLHVGETYIRQTGFRLQDAFTPKLTVAVALENSQYQFSASNAPTNFFFGNAGAAGGLNNPSANYTNQVAPDVLLKASLDPGYGHYELGGIVRLFRDRYYPNGTTVTSTQNDTRVGGGFVANARFPVATKLDIGLHLLAGDGTGRYGASLLPDITVRPNGTLVPLRNAQGLLSLELHATKKLDLFGYAGSEYVQRTFYRNSAGVLVGYAPPTANNTGCNTESAPGAGTGYSPGASPCLGATRELMQGSIGWIYRIYSGPVGKLQYGLAYSHLVRNGWTGVGGDPKTNNNFVYTSFRYYIP